MLSKIKSMSLEGLTGYLVEIQSDVSGGLPNFEIVGLPDVRVKEAKERVKTAIKNFESTIFLGELSLDGKINRVNGVLPMCIEALELGIKRVVLPKENAIEASIIKGLEIIPVEDLLDAIEYITGNLEIPSYVSKENINLRSTQNYEFDFSDVKGQENAKRALEIAATGSHNCLLCRYARFGKKPIIRKNSYNFTRFNI